jgi:hypothetical protein
MLGVLIIGGLMVVLGAEMYIMFNRESKKNKEEHHCNCGHCHCKENNKEEK